MVYYSKYCEVMGFWLSSPIVKKGRNVLFLPPHWAACAPDVAWWPELGAAHSTMCCFGARPTAHRFSRCCCARLLPCCPSVWIWQTDSVWWKRGCFSIGASAWIWLSPAYLNNTRPIETRFTTHVRNVAHLNHDAHLFQKKKWCLLSCPNRFRLSELSPGHTARPVTRPWPSCQSQLHQLHCNLVEGGISHGATNVTSWADGLLYPRKWNGSQQNRSIFCLRYAGDRHIFILYNNKFRGLEIQPHANEAANPTHAYGLQHTVLGWVNVAKRITQELDNLSALALPPQWSTSLLRSWPSRSIHATIEGDRTLHKY